jgi:hypothetical protein
MNLLRIATVTVLAASLAPIAQAQDRSTCRLPPPPVPLAQSKLLKGAEVDRAFRGKAVTIVRQHVEHAQIYVRVRREFRVDGSMAFACQIGDSPAGPWEQCARIGTLERGETGHRDIGVWTVTGNRLCISQTFGGGITSCFEVYRSGTALYAVQVSGTGSCFAGDLGLE